jgi:hypothetical protein
MGYARRGGAAGAFDPAKSAGRPFLRGKNCRDHGAAGLRVHPIGVIYRPLAVVSR